MVSMHLGPLRGQLVVAANSYFHGLGNRIRVTLGSKILAEMEGRDFYYVWPSGSQFGPKLHDLWVVEDRSIPRVVSKILSLRFPYRDGSLDWLRESERNERVWQIRTSHALQLPPAARSWQEEFRSMRPVPRVSERVDEFFRRNLEGAPYVGVMIRAHSASHTKTLEVSPIEWYLKRMRQIRLESPDVKFFISCDLPEAQQYIGQQIGNCFGLVNKGAYNTADGVRSAVADLYLLASSGYLLGPYYSSFVEMAQYLTGARLPLETARTSESHLGHTDFSSIGVVPDPTVPSQRRRGSSTQS